MRLWIALPLAPVVAFACVSERSAGASAAAIQRPARHLCQLKSSGLDDFSQPNAREGLGLASYWTTDAAWIDSDPILVNRDFDFGVAMASDFGPGVAASFRSQANREVAAQLQPLHDLEVEPQVVEALELHTEACGFLQSKELRIYALLFGGKDARFQTILDVIYNGNSVTVHPAQVTRFVVVSEARPLNGEGSWPSDDGAPLRRAIRSAAKAIVRLVISQSRLRAPAGDVKTLSCAIGGNESWTGTPVSLGSEPLTILVRENTVVQCGP